MGGSQCATNKQTNKTKGENMMKTVKQELDEYIAKIYPNGTKPNQDEQVRLAFYSGVVTMLTSLHRAVEEVPEEQVREYLDSIMIECEQFIRGYAARVLMESLLRNIAHSPPEPEPAPTTPMSPEK